MHQLMDQKNYSPSLSKLEASWRPVGKNVEIRANERGHGTLRKGFLESEEIGSTGQAL